MELPYDKTDRQSIVAYAKKLVGHTLNEMCDSQLVRGYNEKSKGRFGNVLEEGYFLYKCNSNPECDFPEAGLELKSTPLKKLARDEKYVAKERLVLSIIDYNEIVKQEFKTSPLFMKSSALLLICYLYEKDKDFLDYIIHLADQWEFPESDLAVIRKDWETIRGKVLAGKAHEITESDTYYLAACTKGASADSLRDQPKSIVKAKQRAYSLKQSYLNYIILSLAGGDTKYGRLLSTPKVAEEQGIEEYALSKFQPYLGMPELEILSTLGLESKVRAKSYYAGLVNSIMNIDVNFEIEEFVKADVEIKTIRVSKTGTIREHISFPAFKYEDILEEEWETSLFYRQISRKFMFVFFKEQEDSTYVLEKVSFWNMPQQDLDKVEEVWDNVYDCVLTGRIVEKIEDGRRYTNFTKATDNPISHIRPHAQTKEDTYPLPIPDQLTQATEYTKHCIWLDRKYVLDNIYKEQLKEY